MMSSKITKKVSISDISLNLERPMPVDQVPASKRCGSHQPDAGSTLQRAWLASFSSRDEIRTEQHRQVICRAKPALNELLHAGADYDRDQFFKKLVLLCVTMSGLGSPLSNSVVKETHPALSSVLKSDDISRLIELPLDNKEHNFLELIQIVMGIRLFNKDCHKGGDGIDDLPELLTRAMDALKQQLDEAIEIVQNSCEKFTSALLAMYPLDKNNSLSSESESTSTNDLKNCLYLDWLRSIYLRKLKEDLRSCERHVESCIGQLRQTLLQLHETVRYRVAIPTAQVYPLFTQLSLIWRELQYETAVLSCFNKVFKTVTTCEIRIKPLPVVRKIWNKSAICVEPNIKLKYRGFCPVTLLETGVLLVGTTIVQGVAYRSSESAEAWLTNPAMLKTFLLKIKSNVVLADILDVSLDDSQELIPQKVNVEVSDAEIQTELHPLPCNIVRNYMWSDWKLRKRAVNLAQITQKVTKSQQTDMSLFRVGKKI